MKFRIWNWTSEFKMRNFMGKEQTMGAKYVVPMINAPNSSLRNGFWQNSDKGAKSGTTLEFQLPMPMPMDWHKEFSKSIPHANIWALK